MASEPLLHIHSIGGRLGDGWTSTLLKGRLVRVEGPFEAKLFKERRRAQEEERTWNRH